REPLRAGAAWKHRSRASSLLQGLSAQDVNTCMDGKCGRRNVGRITWHRLYAASRRTANNAGALSALRLRHTRKLLTPPLQPQGRAPQALLLLLDLPQVVPHAVDMFAGGALRLFRLAFAEGAVQPRVLAVDLALLRWPVVEVVHRGEH